MAAADQPPSSNDPVADVLMALHPPVTIDDSGVGRASYRPRPEHRGRRGFLHGGLAATLADHVGARAAAAALGGAPVVTGRLDVRYRHPIPLADGPYEVAATPTKVGSRVVRLVVTISTADEASVPARVLVQADALFVKIDQDNH